MKNTIFLFVLIISSFSSFAQHFEGTLLYSIHYIPKSENLDFEGLEFRYGNRMVILVKKGFYKSVRYNRFDALETTVYSNTDKLTRFHSSNTDFYLVRNLNNSKINIVKTDTLEEVQAVLCRVYKHVNEATTTFFYVEQTNLQPDENYRYNALSIFSSPILKVIVDNPYYKTIITLTGKNSEISSDSAFIKQDLIDVFPQEELKTGIADKQKTESIKNCFLSHFQYPKSMKRREYIGKINLHILIDENGNALNIQTEPVFFRKYLSKNVVNDNEFNKKLLNEIDKELIKNNSECSGLLNFPAPVSKSGNPVKTLVSIPINLTFDKEFSEIPENENENGEEIFEFSFDDDDFN